MTNLKLEIWACFALHMYIRRMDSGDLYILENFEDLNALEDREQNFNDKNEVMHMIKINGKSQHKQM